MSQFDARITASACFQVSNVMWEFHCLAGCSDWQCVRRLCYQARICLACLRERTWRAGASRVLGPCWVHFGRWCGYFQAPPVCRIETWPDLHDGHHGRLGLDSSALGWIGLACRKRNIQANIATTRLVKNLRATDCFAVPHTFIRHRALWTRITSTFNCQARRP